MPSSQNLPAQVSAGAIQPSSRLVVVVGEVLWDVFPDLLCLGGAPLNFAANANRLGFYPILVSGLGHDDLGRKAAREIQALGLDLSMVNWSAKRSTGTAQVSFDHEGHPTFSIPRPAAYDDVLLSERDLRIVGNLEPEWIYYGTLFASTGEGRATLDRLLDATPRAVRFYDINLRPGFDSLELAVELLTRADVVKLNEPEARVVGRHLGLPSDLDGFCRSALSRFGLRAVCVSLGNRGCAIFDGAEFAQADGEAVAVVDTVGAGDAFSAGVMYGLSTNWPAPRVAQFANRLGALVASRAGAIPEWGIGEVITA